MGIKTFAVAAGAAAMLGGAGIGVAQAGSPAPVTGSSTSVSHEGHAWHTGTDDGTGAHREAEARGRVAEGETHARHTGTDDPATHDAGDDGTRTSPSATPSGGHDAGDDHGSGGHGADD